ncbi:TonB family protein [Tsuneonella sp. HG222]
MADRRTRILGFIGAAGANALILAALLTLQGSNEVSDEQPDLVAIVPASPPPPSPPPPPDNVEDGAAAPPSRGDTAEPAQPEPPRPLPVPQPVPPAPDAGAGAASGEGTAAGSGAGTGGQGSGSGAGSGGAGRGSGTVTPPVRIAGALTDGDYRRANAPRGARGTVSIALLVSASGTVERCTIERSSGYASLDQTTCSLVTQRFRFRPARDAQGQPIAWSVRTDFTWVPR